MSVATEIQRLQTAKADIKNAVNNYLGVDSITDETIDGYADKIDDFGMPMFLEVGATTVRTSASTTENIASNNHIKIYGDDNNSYTLAEWNAMFVEAGYDKDNMTVEPIGIRMKTTNTDEIILFDSYQGRTYSTPGITQGNQDTISFSIYNHNYVTSAGTGTDYTTGKTWSVTEIGNNFVLGETNTGCSWTISKDVLYSINMYQKCDLKNIIHSWWAQTEWMRHRMAISSGISTTKEDGTMGEIQILNLSGSQAAVNEDMYFWIKNDSDVFVNTNKFAKYNLNNRHTANSESLTQAIADAIYNSQKSNGVNMNDTGVNSASKPILAEGSKGAEVIAVDGYWMIITPYISNPNATVNTYTNNIADSPAVYWAKSKNYGINSPEFLYAVQCNKTIITSIINYLKNKESRTVSYWESNNMYSCLSYNPSGQWIIQISVGFANSGNKAAKLYLTGGLQPNN